MELVWPEQKVKGSLFLLHLRKKKRAFEEQILLISHS